MKTLTFVLILCFVSLNILSQDNNSKFSFGLSFTPHLSDKMHNISFGYEDSKEYFDDHFKLGWTTGGFINLTCYTRLGFITNFYVAAKGYQEVNYNDGSQSIRHMNYSYRQLREDYVVKMFNLSGLLATGIEYSVNDNVGLFIEPNFDMNLFPLYDADDLVIDIEKPRFYNIGVRCGFLIR